MRLFYDNLLCLANKKAPLFRGANDHFLRPRWISGRATRIDCDFQSADAPTSLEAPCRPLSQTEKRLRSANC